MSPGSSLQSRLLLFDRLCARSRLRLMQTQLLREAVGIGRLEAELREKAGLQHVHAVLAIQELQRQM